MIDCPQRQSFITNCNFDPVSQPTLRTKTTHPEMLEQISLADLAGIEEAQPTFQIRGRQTPSPLVRSSNSVASFMGSSIRPLDVAHKDKWLELKSKIRTFCQGLGRNHCLENNKTADHDCTGLSFCPRLGEMNFVCMVGAALNDGRSYRPCVTLTSSKNCTSIQKKLTKHILKANTSKIKAYVDMVSREVFDAPMQIDTVISQD